MPRNFQVLSKFCAVRICSVAVQRVIPMLPLPSLDVLYSIVKTYIYIYIMGPEVILRVLEVQCLAFGFRICRLWPSLLNVSEPSVASDALTTQECHYSPLTLDAGIGVLSRIGCTTTPRFFQVLVLLRSHPEVPNLLNFVAHPCKATQAQATW